MGQTSSRRIPDDPFWTLVATARQLQGPNGCPWDRAQTVRSLLPHLVEETWEVFCAARKRDRAHLQEELGDVLYTVLFLTLLAKRQGWFDLRTLLVATRRKMQRRHPHVFGARRARSAHEAYRYWQEAKQREGPRLRSPKHLRPFLVALWEQLLQSRDAVKRCKTLLAQLDETCGRQAAVGMTPRARRRTGRPSGTSHGR